MCITCEQATQAKACADQLCKMDDAAGRAKQESPYLGSHQVAATTQENLCKCSMASRLCFVLVVCLERLHTATRMASLAHPYCCVESLQADNKNKANVCPTHQGVPSNCISCLGLLGSLVATADCFWKTWMIYCSNSSLFWLHGETAELTESLNSVSR